MFKPDMSKCVDMRQYYEQLYKYWENIALACLSDLEDFEYVRKNDEGDWYYTNTGDLVGGER